MTYISAYMTGNLYMYMKTLMCVVQMIEANSTQLSVQHICSYLPCRISSLPPQVDYFMRCVYSPLLS